MHIPGESYSDIILRLVELEMRVRAELTFRVPDTGSPRCARSMRAQSQSETIMLSEWKPTQQPLREADADPSEGWAAGC
jgi:hypothetical protein